MYEHKSNPLINLIVQRSLQSFVKECVPMELYIYPQQQLGQCGNLFCFIKSLKIRSQSSNINNKMNDISIPKKKKKSSIPQLKFQHYYERERERGTDILISDNFKFSTNWQMITWVMIIW